LRSRHVAENGFIAVPVLYACTVLLFVYRLRETGQRVDRLTLRARGGHQGEFLLLPWSHEWYGRKVMLAKLLVPGTSDELIPHLEHARVIRVRRGLMVTGNEVIARASKSTGERYRQTWLCTIDAVAPQEWPAPPRDSVAAGFHPADDDAED